MAVPSPPGQTAKRTASRSTDSYFVGGLITPVSCLLVLWGALAAFVLSGRLARLRWLKSVTPDHRVLIGSAVLAGAGLIVVLAAVLLMGRFARRVWRAAESRTAAAQRTADEQTAAAAAAEAAEAALRNGFQQILVSLGKRNQSLLHRQLRIIDTLEQQAASPTALAELFSLDHLTTRMRRHAESLTILSGAASARSWSGPVPIVDVMRAASAEVEDYTRVTVVSDSDEAVAAAAVTDMIHLLAELIENATLFSPSSTRVEVRAERVANGFAVEVEDRGLGIPPDQLRELNASLAEPPDFGLADADRLGLFVAGRLAVRHGVHVSLSPSPYLGTKAVVVLPDSIVVPATASPGLYPERTRGDAARLNLRAPQVLSLSGTAPQARTATDGTADGPANGAAEGAVRAAAPAPRSAPTTANGLPRRVRAESQVSGDADDGPAVRRERPAPRPAPVDAPAPEEARSLAASLQNSWHRSRHAHAADRADLSAGQSADDSNEEA
jgi:signal transduction histidine kinase